MSQKLFIGGLSWDTDDNSLRDAFNAFGEITEAKVVIDRDTGRSRGFGFLSFADAASAKKAIADMDGREVDGRAVRVSEANDRPRR